MKRHLTIINVLLIAVAVSLGVKMFYKLLTDRVDQAQLSKAALNAATTPQNEPIPLLSDYDPIIERNLFNTKKGTGGQPKMVDIGNLKPTSLKLTLLGTVTGDQDKAFAVIQDATQKQQQLYRTGDAIQNATLKMILREKVVLRVNGKDEVLEIEDGSSRPKQTRQRQRLGKAALQNISLNRSQIEASFKNINNLMKQVRVRPHFTNGKPDGLRLTQIKPNSIFHKMGIKNGDVVTGVNGNIIASVDDALTLYQNLRSSSSIQLQLKRRGRMKTIDYHIK
jgi:general secretion pathway protein C